MDNIIKFSHFKPDEFGHGGNKRTAQIDYLLNKAGLTFANIEISPARSGNRIKSFLKGFFYAKGTKAGLKNTYAIGNYRNIFRSFAKMNSPQLFILEAAVEFNLMLPQFLKSHHIPTIAVPHNLESLVKGNTSVFSGKKAPQWLFEEMKFLANCNSVFTISQEENWLLSIMGINSHYLPYYPTPKIENYLLAIRAKRIKNKTPEVKQVLLLGTFYNLPTIEGYKELLSAIIKKNNIKIFVAGYGSEVLNNQFDHDKVVISGAVDNEKLAQLMVDCDCAVVHQSPTSGALTRITEMLISGIPVLANTNAARSHYHKAGLVIYDSMDELLMELDKTLPTVPLQSRPKEEDFFIMHVKNMPLNTGHF